MEQPRFDRGGEITGRSDEQADRSSIGAKVTKLTGLLQGRCERLQTEKVERDQKRHEALNQLSEVLSQENLIGGCHRAVDEKMRVIDDREARLPIDLFDNFSYRLPISPELVGQLKSLGVLTRADSSDMSSGHEELKFSDAVPGVVELLKGAEESFDDFDSNVNALLEGLSIWRRHHTEAMRLKIPTDAYISVRVKLSGGPIDGAERVFAEAQRLERERYKTGR